MPGARGPVPVSQDSKPDLSQQILNLLGEKPELQTNNEFPESTQAEIKAGLDRLASRSMVEYDTSTTDQVALTQEAETICQEGSHEYKVWDAIKTKGKLTIKELLVRVTHKIYFV